MKQEKIASATLANNTGLTGRGSCCEDDECINDPALLPADIMASMSDSVYTLLEGVGEDPEREGLLKTPERVARSLAFLTRGYRQDPEEMLKKRCYGSV